MKNGCQLYHTHCAKCHATPAKNIEGPSLFEGLFDRLPEPSQEYFIRFVKNSALLESSGDTYIEKIKSIYTERNIEHKYEGQLSDKELQDILVYILVSNKKSVAK